MNADLHLWIAPETNKKSVRKFLRRQKKKKTTTTFTTFKS